MKTKIEKAHEFYAEEHSEYGMYFDHNGCVEDIAALVNNEIARDIPELGIELI